MKKIRDYFWADALEDIYKEEITVEQHVKGVIADFEDRGGEYAALVPVLRKIDKALSDGTAIKDGKKKKNAQDELLHFFCSLLTYKIQHVYRNAKKIETKNKNGSVSISTALTEEEKEYLRPWKWSYWELHYAWDRLANGEPYKEFAPRWNRINDYKKEMETV